MADLAAAQQRAADCLQHPEIAAVAERHRRGVYSSEWAHQRLGELGVTEVWVRIYVLSLAAGGKQ